MSKPNLANRYPNLFETAIWGPIQARFDVVEQTPDESLIANVNIVPFCSEGWIIIRMKDGQWEIPGGTLEPGETYLSAARRELFEEAGVLLKSLRIFGAWHCTSSGSKPYRAHLPFPEFHRLVGIGEVEIVGNPTNPPGGEMVAKVKAVPIGEAVKRFKSINRPDLSELYQLASEVAASR